VDCAQLLCKFFVFIDLKISLLSGAKMMTLLAVRRIHQNPLLRSQLMAAMGTGGVSLKLPFSLVRQQQQQMTTTFDKSPGRLAEAVEALTKAALAEAETPSLSVGREAVACLEKLSSDSAALKESIDLKFDTTNQKLESIDLKFDTTNQKLDEANTNILTMIKTLNDTIQEQHKLQRIGFAIENVHHGSFNYRLYREDDYHGYSLHDEVIKSSDLARDILFAFRKGGSMNLPRGAVFAPTVCNSDVRYEADKGEQAFRDSIVDQIFSLTGTKPRVNKEGGFGGRYDAIYYS
jgi:hypothetical protein